MHPGDDPSDPAIERVRHELARLGRDEASAPAVPADVTARIAAALQTAGEPAHAIERPRLRRGQAIGLTAGLVAVVGGVLIGTSLLTREPPPRFSHGSPTAERITVSHAPPVIPLTGPQLVALLTAPPDYGPLSDPSRRAGCLEGLGYAPTTRILGARSVDVDGRAAVLMLLPADSAADVRAVLVEVGCSAAHSGLLAETAVARS